MKKRKQKRRPFLGIALALGVILIGSHNFYEYELLPNLDALKPLVSTEETASAAPERTTSEDQEFTNQLAALEYESGEAPVYQVNGGVSTLDMADWQENRVIYGELDTLNRTTSVMAYLNQDNLGRSEGRSRQVWQPTGWHQKRVAGEMIYNRGHLLAYTSSFNLDEDGQFSEGEEGSLDNPKNLATQSAFSNQKIQTKYETLVREAQGIQKNLVSYRIETIFRGEERMPRGFWLQAKDSQGTLDFNVYLFNVQPNIRFDYSSGSSKLDPAMTVPSL